jgi:hypothetical protein
MRWLSRLFAASNVSILVVGLVTITLVSFRFNRVVELIFSPIFFLCRLVTPIEWQTLGNVLLGFCWFAVGIVMYGCILGLLTILAFDLRQALGRHRQTK